MNAIISPCALCDYPQGAIDVALKADGPERAALKFKMPLTVASPGGALYEHWQHLNRAMLMPTKPPTMPDVDTMTPVDKVRWGQKRLFAHCFAMDLAPDVDPQTDPQTYVNVIRAKTNAVTALMATVRLEAELSGHLETAKQLGKRRADEQIAKSEELLSEEERLALAKNALRAKGYHIERIVEETPPIEVNDEQTDDANDDE